MNLIKFLIAACWITLSIGCQSMKSKSSADATKDKANQIQPKLTKPMARRIWVEPEITDNGAVYIDGHWKYLLLKDSQWTK